jgi:hypothetical protein
MAFAFCERKAEAKAKAKTRTARPFLHGYQKNYTVRAMAFALFSLFQIAKPCVMNGLFPMPVWRQACYVFMQISHSVY